MGPVDLLRLNHYWSRSLADLEHKILRGDASTPEARDRDWHFKFELQLNDEEDKTIVPIVSEIREHLKRLPNVASFARL
jgi:hypothetical protein